MSSDVSDADGAGVTAAVVVVVVVVAVEGADEVDTLLVAVAGDACNCSAM